MKEVPRIIERQIPMLTHLQISEALRYCIGEILPNKVLEFQKKKLEELCKFVATYSTVPANMNYFGTKIRNIGNELYKNCAGCTTFVFGRDYAPNMSRDQAMGLTMMDKLQIADLKKGAIPDSIFEYMIEKLDDIREEKAIDNETAGNDFAGLLDKADKISDGTPRHRKGGGDGARGGDNYYDEYGMEDYGDEMMM